MIPGEYILSKGDIEANKAKGTIQIIVKNTGDRPIQVGSHFHFFEANRALVFPRKKAFGRRLNIPAGTAVRFEPGQEREVRLVEFGGNRVGYGLNALTDGKMNDEENRKKALARAREKGFGVIDESANG